MSKFDNDDYSADKRRRNDLRDRSVPSDENYYRSYDFDFDSIKSSNADVRDNQANNRESYIDLNAFNQSSQRNRNTQQSPPQRKKSSGKKKKSISKAKARLIAVLAILLAIVIFISAGINSILGKITYDERIDNQYVDASALKSEKDVTNILLLGVDARIIKGEEAENSRSDSMMLISIDKKNNCIKTVSFLRDTWVYIPCKDIHHRLNSACVYGGYNGVVDTIEYNFGVDIDGYVVVNFSVFQKLVDSIGGVEIEITEKEAKEVNNHKVRYGNVTLEAGKQVLTGKQALAYCRIRKIDSDFVRTKRQRTVIKSIISGIKSKPLKIFSIANGCAEYIETNLSKRELKKLALKTAGCLGTEMFEEKIPFEGTWEYATKSGMSVIAVNYEKNKDRLIDFIYNKTADELQAEKDAEAENN